MKFVYDLGTDLDWNFKTQNEKYACLKNGGSCTWPRGKNMGGTTVHHGMAYHRGNRKDYEKWVEMGNTEWSWEKVKFFRKKLISNPISFKQLKFGKNCRYSLIF